MGESARNLEVEDGRQLRFIEVPDERTDAVVRRTEVRSVLVRLLVKLYVERHEELVKEAA